jgi:hypothetical protein
VGIRALSKNDWQRSSLQKSPVGGITKAVLAKAKRAGSNFNAVLALSKEGLLDTPFIYF